MTYRSLFLLAILAGGVKLCLAQDLVTDRPDFTESPVAVPGGTVQLELGATRETDEDLDVLSGPEALLRWSPNGEIELRLGVPDYVDADGASGLGDSSLGVKVELPSVGEWEFGAIVTASIPTGESAFSTGTIDPEFLVTGGRDIGSWSLGLQAAVSYSKGIEETALASTIVAGTNLSDTIGSFIELFAVTPAGEPAAILLHHGYTLSLSPTMQADIHAAVGLTDDAPDFLVGIGWSGRF